VTSLTVAVPSPVRIGQSIQASATAAKSDGSAQLVGTGWRSSNPAVATVTDAGSITGVANGPVTISVTFGGQQGQRDIRVLPDYEGVWTGTLRVASCTPLPTPAYAHHCAGYVPGSVFPVSMTLAQAGEALTGQFTANGLVFSSFVVPIAADGGAALLGTNVAPPYLNDALFSVNSPGRGQMTGTARWERRGNSGLVGTATVEGTSVTLTR
jgi:hypothetical protein